MYGQGGCHGELVRLSRRQSSVGRLFGGGLTRVRHLRRLVKRYRKSGTGVCILSGRLGAMCTRESGLLSGLVRSLPIFGDLVLVVREGGSRGKSGRVVSVGL